MTYLLLASTLANLVFFAAWRSARRGELFWERQWKAQVEHTMSCVAGETVAIKAARMRLERDWRMIQRDAERVRKDWN